MFSVVFLLVFVIIALGFAIAEDESSATTRPIFEEKTPPTNDISIEEGETPKSRPNVIGNIKQGNYLFNKPDDMTFNYNPSAPKNRINHLFH